MILEEISLALQSGRSKLVVEKVNAALAEGIDPSTILNEGLLAGMNVVGEKFQKNEVYVPEVLVAARAMNKGTDILKPLLADAGAEPLGRACIGTIQGDLHDIGKNLVRMMLEGKGIEVIDLGVSVDPETFISTAIEKKCDIICCSALLTTTMGHMKDVCDLATEKGIRDQVYIMVGGAPVTQAFCDQIGADCYTSDAASASDKAAEYLRGKKA